jgi:hypothetical protein
VSSDNPLHHLWLNNGTWWVHYTLNFDFRTRRVRRSLGTRDAAEAVWPGKGSSFPRGGPPRNRPHRFPRPRLFPTPACPSRPASSDPCAPANFKEHPMTKGPPECPPAADWGPSLIEHYPPHGFPPYLGLGLLDTATLRLEPGRSVAEYRSGSDLVYRVTGTFDPAEGDTACAAKSSEWSIEEFFDGRAWRTTDGYESLPQAFYHHIGGQLPTENPRLAALIERLVCDFNVAVRIRTQTSYVMFPAGYVYAVRVPLTPDTVENFNAFAAAEPGPASVPLPSCAKPRSVAILTLSTTCSSMSSRAPSWT